MVKLIFAITGASGTPFALKAFRRLLHHPNVGQITLMSSQTGQRCLGEETGLSVEDLANESDKVLLEDDHNLGSPIASGSHVHGGMVILPCSMGSLARLAGGISTNLILRAADVCLKERRKLILGLRETPLNRIHLENMLRIHDAGALLLPLMPAFYHRPQELEDLYEAYADRLLDHLGLVASTKRRWAG